MNEPVWLTEALVIDIHSEQLAIFGGPAGIRDMGLLSSALARAPNKFAYGETDLAALAATYVFGISKNHPFIDGNKRASFAALIVFLGLNGVDFLVPETHATAMILEVAAGNVSEEGLTRWLRDNWPPT
jgi:death-on-curing protein